ncbi:MAG: response regulator transcription factor [Flavobacteriales bacterium]|nr:Response regulator MprA [Flavobacteriales bacterium]MCC6576321.1 response regulator transcription factor [Flavobacteriales bacterium]NUQ15244.1 response regulator transcription factor [Flavobacteriales bacterium]
MQPGSKPRVLLVEDEEGLRQTLRLNLELEGYHVTTAATGPEALERLRGARFDAAVMDVMLPGMDGFAVCEKARLEGDRTPVLFLTARTAVADRVRGLRTGDDHLGKPFDLEELMLRLAKLVARPEDRGPATLPERYRFGPNEVDLVAYEAHGVGGSRTLSQREVMLLRLLFEHAGQVVSREEILHKVWGYDVFPTTRTIDNFIVAFRKLFEPDGRNPVHFHSIRGVGYKFTP